jgi:putative NADH-flavin reductase
MMRIVIFGAAGSVGARVVAEALSRGHVVRAVVRNQDQLSSLPAGVERRIGNATSVEQVAALSADQDLVISATRPAAGQEQELVAAAKALLAGVTHNGARLLLIGGAASLKVSATGRRVVDEPGFVPVSLREISVACCMQFDVCTADEKASWTYISPPALLVPGKRTGRYRSGHEHLLFDSEGNSTISLEDFAVAVLDEAESPRHYRSRFTVAAAGCGVSEAGARP